MLWIDPNYRPIFRAASADDYGSLAQLAPMDDYVEKQGRSTGRYRIAADGEVINFYLKKYLRLPWWRRWLAPASWFPGPVEWANLNRVATLGVAVPEPLAAGADRLADCKSMLAVRELEGYTPLHQYVPAMFAGPDSSEGRRRRRWLAARVADIARRLHTARLFHCDFYLCHFFIRRGAGFQPANVGRGTGWQAGSPPHGLLGSQREHTDLVLIDFTRLRQSVLPRWRVKDLAQLLYSSDLPGITRTDRLRFFKCYLGTRWIDKRARRLIRSVLRKAAQYHRHNASLAKRAAA